ncbi:beta-1,6-N-acetylglucosaminyltransferase [Flavobacterium sp.]|uniref:beta-1,6-N-acetylglucosaminyltransferase n=1 Tax=Flavobacterium sp. TaxID=239 RepID=UPI0025C6FA26|nr:beta-1,6-N-acetylglucosaminyltransferase [Flavobacterium sp.]
MKIGFSILSHKEPDQVYIELVNQLAQYPDYSIAIHHDKSKSAFDATFFKEANIDIVKETVITHWSHVNNIEALLKTFELLYDKNCDWFVTLSANCFPIKRPAQLIDFLKNSTFDGYIECNNVNTDYFDFYQYFRKAFETRMLFQIPFFRKSGKFYWKPIRVKRKKYTNIFKDLYIPYHGSDWFMINRKAMKYILENKKDVKKITEFLRDVNQYPDLNVCPPEVVFQTLLANNKAMNLNNNNYRYIDWTNAVNWHPNNLKEKDYDVISHSEAFFARKFDASLSMSLLEKIKEHILNNINEK